MGLFDSLAKNVLGSLSGGSDKQDPAAMLSGLLSDTGGLQGLMGKFQSAGLGEHFSSWVGTGENKAVQADEVQNAVGADVIQQLAGKLGMQTQTILPLLAQFLPQVIDKLTPNGQLPQGDDLMAQGLSLLKGKLFG